MNLSFLIYLDLDLVSHALPLQGSTPSANSHLVSLFTLLVCHESIGNFH